MKLINTIVLLLLLTALIVFTACSSEDNKDSKESLNIFVIDTNATQETNTSDENISTSKGIEYDELIEFKSKEKDLEYLFEDSKFPVDDYILKAGKKQRNQDVYQAFKDTKKKQESLDEIKKKQEAEFRKQLQKELLEKSGARKGNIMLDKNGNPMKDCKGEDMYDNIEYDSNNCPILDANGNPRYKNVLYDENGNPVFDENGNLVTKQSLFQNKDKGNAMLDENGNPILDSKGQPKYNNVAYDKNGNVLYNKDGTIALLNDPVKGKMLVDKDGNPLLDCNGNPMYEKVAYGKDNCPLVDEKNKPALKVDDKKGKMLLDKDGNPILDCHSNPKYENVLYDNNNCPIYDESGEVLVKDKTLPQVAALEKEKQELQKLIEEQKKLNQQMQKQINQGIQGGANGTAGGGGAYYPYNVNSLIRDSVLAERGNTNIAFSKPSTRYGVDSFSNQQNVDESTHEHRLYRTIRAGRLIPALLTTAISSDIEGPVTAVVEQDIYAAMGQAVLIPRGSKVIGFYQNDNKIGQDRLSIVWREIITPQGVNILLTKAITSDNLGMSGARGSVNNKYFERYGIPYGISTLSNVLLLAIASKTSNNTYAESIYQQSSKDVSTLVENIIEQQAAIKPTIEIRAGSRIYITPSAHIWFPIPQNGAVMAEFFNDDI